VRNSLEIARGYNAGMGLEGRHWAFRPSLFVLGANVLLCGLLAVRRPFSPRAACVGLFLLATLFLRWKHGFIRDDGHVFIEFFDSVAVLPFLVLAAAPALQPSLVARGLLAVSLLLSLHCFQKEPINRFGELARAGYAKVWRTWADVTHPAELQARLDQIRAAARERWRLPAIRARVGDAAVDMFAYEQGVLLLNDLAWSPRPIFQGYSAYTGPLVRLNEEYYDGDRAPRYVLLKLAVIDCRFPGHEDGGALLALLRRYQPVLKERDYWLLERRGGDAGPPPAGGERVATVRLGEELPVEAAPGEYVTAAVDLQLTAAGRLLQTAYRPPVVRLRVVLEDGETRSFRLLPEMARRPFLLSPLVTSGDDWAALFGSGPVRRIRSVSVTADRMFKRQWYQPDVRLTLARYPLPPSSPSGAGPPKEAGHTLARAR
jgi:hypothetical protein